MVDLNSCEVSADTFLGKPEGVLGLRICGSRLDGKVIRIRAQKCSIGGAADCGIRINSSEARPLHCVLFRGRRGVLVRRWAPDTLLNGRSFSEAWLQAGDRLTVGPLDFEVLADDSQNVRGNQIENEEQTKRQGKDKPAPSSNNPQAPTQLDSSDEPAAGKIDPSSDEADNNPRQPRRTPGHRFGRRDHGASPESQARKNPIHEQQQQDGMLTQLELMQKRLDEIERSHLGEESKSNPIPKQDDSQPGGRTAPSQQPDSTDRDELLARIESLESELGECRLSLAESNAEAARSKQAAASALTESDSRLEQQRWTFQANESILKDELAQLTAKLAEVETQFESTEAKLESTVAQLESTEAELAATEAELESSAAQLAETEAELELSEAQPREELNLLTDQILALQAESLEKDQAFDELTEQLEQTRTDADSTQAAQGEQLGCLTEQLETAMADLALARSDQESLNEQLSTLRSEQEQASLREQEEVQLEQEKAAALDQQVKSLEEEADNRDKELAKLRDQLEQEQQASAGQIETLQEQLDRDGQQCQALNDEIESLREQLPALETALQDEQAANEQTASEWQDKIEQLENELGQVRQENEANLGRTNELLEEVGTLSEALSASQEEAAEWKDQASQPSQVQEQLEEVSKQREESDARFSELQTQLEELEATLADRKRKHDQELEAANDQVNQLQLQLDAQNESEAKAVASLTVSADELQELRSELQRAQGELARVDDAASLSDSTQLPLDGDVDARIADLEAQLETERQKWDSDRSWFEAELEARGKLAEEMQREKAVIEQRLVETDEERQQLEFDLMQARQDNPDVRATAAPAPNSSPPALTPEIEPEDVHLTSMEDLVAAVSGAADPWSAESTSDPAVEEASQAFPHTEVDQPPATAGQFQGEEFQGGEFQGGEFQRDGLQDAVRGEMRDEFEREPHDAANNSENGLADASVESDEYASSFDRHLAQSQSHGPMDREPEPRYGTTGMLDATANDADEGGAGGQRLDGTESDEQASAAQSFLDQWRNSNHDPAPESEPQQDAAADESAFQQVADAGYESGVDDVASPHASTYSSDFGGGDAGFDERGFDAASQRMPDDESAAFSASDESSFGADGVEDFSSPQADPYSSEVDEPGAPESDHFAAAPERGVESGSAEQEEVAFSSLDNEPPVSTADILAKFGVSVDGDEEESSASGFAQPSPEPEPVAAPSAGPSNDPWRAAIDEDSEPTDEDDISNYMDRLLKRVRGDDEPTAESRPSPQSRPAPAAAPVQRQVEPAAPVSETPAPEAPMRADEFVPRHAAPEKDLNLQAMRELANHQANKAIVTHEKRSWAESAHGKRVTAFTAFIVGALIIFFAGWQSLIGYVGGISSFLMGIYWLQQAGRHALTSRKIVVPTDEAHARESERRAAQERENMAVEATESIAEERAHHSQAGESSRSLDDFERSLLGK